MWGSVDPAEQFWNSYAYSTNPINTVDPDGQNFLGAAIGLFAGAYFGGAMSNGFQFNPDDWNWKNPSTFLGIFGGALSGAQMGSRIENFIANTHFEAGNVPRTAYGVRSVFGARGGVAEIRNSYLTHAEKFYQRKFRGIPYDFDWSPKIVTAELIYMSSDAFGVEGANHVFIYSTETGMVIGRAGISGQRLMGAGGNPATATKVYGTIRMDAAVERSLVPLMVNDPMLQGGVYFPWVDECHTALKNTVTKYGIKYIPEPNGLFDFDNNIMNWLGQQNYQIMRLYGVPVR